MEWADLTKSAIGAVVGFSLAQLVNLAVLVFNYWRRARLRIEPIGEILDHSTQHDIMELTREVVFGFAVRNVGKRVVSNVRFQILTFSVKRPNEHRWSQVEDLALALHSYQGAEAEAQRHESTTLVPGAAVVVELARWWESHGTLRPSSHGLPDYFEESYEDAEVFAFNVVAFDDQGTFATGTIGVTVPQ